MRRCDLGDYIAPASRTAATGGAARTEQTEDRKQLRSRSSASAAAKITAGKVVDRTKAIKAPAQFAPLPLQQARVLQQLQAISLNTKAASHKVSEAPLAHPARQARHLLPRRKPVVSRQHKLQSLKYDSAGNTDSEIESPLSQPRSFEQLSPVAADPELQVRRSPAEAGSASTPARSAPENLEENVIDSVADSPESMAMSTPACGQQPPSSGASPLIPMSCSTAGNRSVDQPRLSAMLPFGSPMCISPDNWGTPQQIQWEVSTDNPSAGHGSPQAASQHAPLPSASQLQAANLEFGFDAIKAAGGAAKSRLASTTSAARLSESASRDDGGHMGFEGLDGNAEWMDDFEVTPSMSEDDDDADADHDCNDAAAPHSQLHLSLDCDDQSSSEVSQELDSTAEPVHFPFC